MIEPLQLREEHLEDADDADETDEAAFQAYLAAKFEKVERWILDADFKPSRVKGYVLSPFFYPLREDGRPLTEAPTFLHGETLEAVYASAQQGFAEKVLQRRNRAEQALKEFEEAELRLTQLNAAKEYFSNHLKEPSK